MFVSTRVCLHVCAFDVYGCTYVCVCICMFVCECVCIHSYVCLCVCAVHVCILACVCVSVCLSVCLSVYVQTTNVLFYHTNSYLPYVHRSKPTLSRSEKKALQTKRDYINQNVRPAKVTINVHNNVTCHMIHISNDYTSYNEPIHKHADA